MNVRPSVAAVTSRVVLVPTIVFSSCQWGKKTNKQQKHLMYGLLTSEFQGKVGRKHIHTARHSLWQVPKQTSDWLQWNISGKRAREGEMMGLSSLLEAVFLLHRGSFEGGEKKKSQTLL